MIKKGRDGSVIHYTQKTRRAILKKFVKKIRLHLLLPCRSMEEGLSEGLCEAYLRVKKGRATTRKDTL